MSTRARRKFSPHAGLRGSGAAVREPHPVWRLAAPATLPRARRRENGYGGNFTLALGHGASRQKSIAYELYRTSLRERDDDLPERAEQTGRAEAGLQGSVVKRLNRWGAPGVDEQ
jgi:hypothetical protein